jgi:hypothetical protein
VDGQAKSTLEGTDVIFEKVRIFVQVDCFEGELSEPLASVSVGC